MKLTSPSDPSSALTKREYFAALAMQGFCANGAASKLWKAIAADSNPALAVAQCATEMADALVKALNLQPEAIKDSQSEVIFDHDSEDIHRLWVNGREIKAGEIRWTQHRSPEEALLAVVALGNEKGAQEV